MLCNFVFGFLFIWKSITVNGQTLVSPSVIKEGESFTVTCDASRAAVPTTATSVVSLVIGWTAGTAVPTTYARYRVFSSPYNSTFLPQTSPPRNWTFNFSGSQQGTSDLPNNRNTMKIEMVIYDAKCSDAGLYFCNATYFSPGGDMLSTNIYQNVISITQAVPLYVLIYPQYEEGLGPYESVNPAGSNVTMTCRVHGPKVLTFIWRYGPSSSDVNSFTSYPVQNAISVDEPVQISSGTTCVQYRHTSTLKFQTEDMYDGYMYVCVATENNEDTIVGNITIHTKPATPAPAPEEDTSGCPNRVMKKASEPKSTTPTTRRTLPTPPDNDGYVQVNDTSWGYVQVGETARQDSPYGATDPTSAREPNVKNETHYYSSIDHLHINGLQQNQTVHYNNLPQNSQSTLDTDRKNNSISTKELNEYTNVYDTPEETAYNDTANAYLTPKFDS